MNILNVNVENCYGIIKLNYNFEFDDKNDYLIYVTNGLIKHHLQKPYMQ